jgi:Conjugal transfer protein
MPRKIPFVAAILVAGSVLRPVPATARPVDSRIARLFGQDTMRVPYTAGRVYEIRLIPGSPFAVELPAGETAKNIWFDQRWWAAESTPGSSQIFLRALGTEDVVGRKGFIHIETEPSDYRISLHVVGVEDTTDVGAGIAIYVEGSALNDPARREVRRLADKELLYMQFHEQEKARAEFDSWRKKLLQNVRADYEWGGDFRISRVVDDRVQTFVSLPEASDRAVIQFIDKTGKAELVNYELENGTYVIQNKVLRPGEKFRLVLGKQQAWVALK